MQTRVFARLIRKCHRKTRSMQKTADQFNAQYGTSKSKGWYYNVAYLGVDPTDIKLRENFGLGPRVCPSCHHKPRVKSDKPKPPRLPGIRAVLNELPPDLVQVIINMLPEDMAEPLKRMETQ